MSFHKIKLLVTAAALIAGVVTVLAYGFDYYGLDIGDRAVNQKHAELRPGGTVGVRLGQIGAILFCCLYAYPIRKRWRWLQRFGKTKHWLDFHVLFGITAPLVITVHSSFKLQGLAGVAYWLMMAVMASGFVGRYFYAQIPRSLNAAALTLDELAALCADTRSGIEGQNLFSSQELGQVLKRPDQERIEQMSLPGALFAMIRMDLERPFRVAALRRQLSSTLMENIRTAGGFFASSNKELEQAVELIRRQSWLMAKVAFLGRANQVFQLWHVVHRPFSYSFAVLACIHIALVLLMGYY
jgi:hypothetical protein